MLTNEAKSKLENTIVTDVNANVPAPTAAPQRMLSPEAALLFDRSVVAKPLMVPEVCSLHVKNTEYRYRWVNHKSENGRVYKMRRAQGFVNATADDVDVLNGDVVADGGEITAGDLILMKMRADRYDAAIKHNMERAMALQRARGMYMSGASSDVNSDAAPQYNTIANDLGERTGLAKAFIPSNVEDLVAKSEATGSAEQARQTVSEIRENIKKNPSPKKVD